ncbi:MAG: MFS transporter [Bacteroidales bacterium]|nr:MFS transporter [Bacteroidales bacterium]
MKDRKYILSLIVLYLNYFLHGIGCAVLGQSVIKDSLAASWGTTAMAITAISAALGLGRLIALPIAGPFSDKFGRKASVVVGGLFYAAFLGGLAYSSGNPDGYRIAYICAILGGIANSFLDTGVYPALGEIVIKAPSVATMGIKFSMAISQMLLPFVIGATAVVVSGVSSYDRLFLLTGLAYLVLAIAIFFLPLPTDQKENIQKEGLLSSIRNTKFSAESIAMILIGFTCTGTFQLWLNCAQNFAKDVVLWAEPSIMQTFYSAGTLIAVVVTAMLTRKIKDERFIVLYPIICLLTLLLVLFFPSKVMMEVGAFAIGWAGAGGLLQIVTAVCNLVFPKIKGTVTALVMIASSLCNYTLLSAAAGMTSSGVMWMNVILTSAGIILGVFVNSKLRIAAD